MRHYRLIRLLLATAIALMAVGVWASGRIQQSADDAVTRLVDSGQRMLIAMLDQETGLRGYINTRREAFLQPYERGRSSWMPGSATLAPTPRMRKTPS